MQTLNSGKDNTYANIQNVRQDLVSVSGYNIEISPSPSQSYKGNSEDQSSGDVFF